VFYTNKDSFSNAGYATQWGANHDSMLLQQQEDYREMS
jgi:hypothetical protein